jgi:hypothetical protein
MKKRMTFYGGMTALTLVVVLAAGSYYAQQTTGSPVSDEDFIYQPGPLRNPFIPLLVMTPTPTLTPLPTETPTPEAVGGRRQETGSPTPTPIPFPEIQLNGIFGAGDNPVAIINNQVLRAGEYIAGARVTVIREDTVYLDFYGRTMKLVLPEEYSISID